MVQMQKNSQNICETASPDLKKRTACEHVLVQQHVSGYRPFFEFQEDLPQPTSSTDHVHLDGSQEGKVDFDYILGKLQKSLDSIYCNLYSTIKDIFLYIYR